ncbi:MAG: hypothetical protein ACKO2G_14445 [Verrucomicrobiales bacterium]
MQPTSTLLCLFFLLPMVGGAQQILQPEVRSARPVEEPAAPEEKKAGPETHSTPPIAPVQAPEEKEKEKVKEKPPENPAKNPPAPEKKPPPANAKTVTPPDGETTIDAPVSALNAASLLPIGVPSFDVRMPEFNGDRLVSRMRVRQLTRIDDDQLDLLDMDLERYLSDGNLDYVVNVERGFYALSTGRLISSAPTRLRGKAMDLHGQGCVYSKDNEVIKILGKVTSYIYVEGGKLTGSKPKPPAEESPSDAKKGPPESPVP